MSSPLDQNIEQLTRRSIPRALFTLSLPIVLAGLLQISHQLANTFWVGHIGAQAVAAVSASFPIIFLLMSIGGGLSIAGSILVAQHAGARDQKMVNHIAAQTLLMISVISLALAAIGYVIAPTLLRWMGIGTDIFTESQHYLRVSFLGVPCVFIFNMFQSILRGVGEVKAPLYLVGGGVILNLLLDPLLIFGWGPIPAGGVAGAAYATFLTQGIVAAVGLRLLFSRRFGVQLNRADLPPDRALIKRVLLLGIPASIEQSMQALSVFVMTALVAGFGTIAVASYGIGMRFFTFMLIPAFGISQAASTLVGHSFGAGDPRQARAVARTCTWIGFWSLAALSLPLIAGTAPLLRVFVPHDPVMQAMGADTLRIMALALAPIGIQMSLTGALRGAGDTLVPMLLAVVGAWALQLPLAWVLAKHTVLGTDGLWWSYPLTNAVLAAVVLLRFRYGRWQSSKLVAPRCHSPSDAGDMAIEKAHI